MLIRGGRVVDPVAEIDSLLDVRVSDGIIAEVAEHLQPFPGEEVVNASNAYVAPGFIDMHVHLREPGQFYKETIQTGTAAAARGGFTAVACMPNTQPAIDSVQTVNWLNAKIASDATVRVYPIAAMTAGRAGQKASDIGSLAKSGAVAFSDDGSTLEREDVQQEVAGLAAAAGSVIISHSEPEEAIVARDMAIAERTGARWHVAHVSTAWSLELIRSAKGRGVAVTCEATPHHLVFAADRVQKLGPASAVHPPLRSERDVESLRAAVRDGTVDALASDHAPHTNAEKFVGNGKAAPGFSGLEVALGAYAYALPNFEVMRFVRLLSTNPARILKVRGGSLLPGEPADITVFADREWRVDSAAFVSKGKCTPFDGMRLPRQAIATIVGGKLVMKEGRVLS